MYDLLKAGFEIIIVAVAAYGLDEKWLGRRINEACIEELISLNEKYGINVAGEGGEYETFVIDCPLYKKRIEIEEAVKTWDGSRGSCEIKKARLIDK